MKRTVLSWLLCSLCVAGISVLSAGCGDDSNSSTAPPDDSGFVPATTPDLAVENLVLAWEEMNFAEYTKLLTTDFLFFFDPEDEVSLYVGTPAWQLPDELDAVDRIFSKKHGIDPIDEVVIPPVHSIEFNSFIALDPEWEDPGSDPLYAGTLRQRYQVSMRVFYEGESLSSWITGVQYLYAEAVEVDGVELWQIKIWEDRGDSGGTKASVETLSWGTLKAWFWNGSTEPRVPQPVELATPSDEQVTQDSVYLSWSRSYAPDFGYYEVFLEGDGGGQDQSLVKFYNTMTTHFLVEDLSPSTEYSFRVDVISAPGLVGTGNPVTVTTDEFDPFPPARSPDMVMENFQKVWEQLNFVEYSELLADEFSFYFDPNDGLDEFVGGPSWGLAAELSSVQAMFSGQAGVDPVTAEVVPPILSLELMTFSPLDPNWQDPGTNQLYASTVRQRYQVSMRVIYQGQELTTFVSGVNYFYVTPVEVDGQILWQIKIWEDRGSEGGSKAATDESSWGALKALWY